MAAGGKKIKTEGEGKKRKKKGKGENEKGEKRLKNGGEKIIKMYNIYPCKIWNYIS